MKAKILKFKSQLGENFYKIFPHLFIEAAIAITIICLPWYASGLSFTATTGQEMSLMNPNASYNPTINQMTSDDDVGGNMVITGIEETTTSKEITFAQSQMCFIGDSRFNEMKNSIATEALFITDDNVGLNWFVTDASTAYHNNGQKEICIVALGVRDITRASDYISVLNEFANKYSNKYFVFVTVGPVDEEKYTDVTNEAIDNFNNTVTAGLNSKWQVIDLNNFVREHTFSTHDGLHYATEDYRETFAWIVNSVKTQTITG